ncbi:MAG: rhodanese-like domain-containing protein [Candidatus Methylomirabilia bacterium]
MEQITPRELKARLDWEVEFRTEELNPEEESVVFCHQGIRSAAVAESLRQLSCKKAVNLTGGLDAWARAADSTMPRYQGRAV